MKKRILLPAICLVISALTLSCSTEIVDDLGQKSASTENMLTITVTAGTTEDFTATRATLEEKAGATSPWKWEANDKVKLRTTNPAGQKVVTELKLDASTAGKIIGTFKGEIPANNVTSGNSYRFFYVGDRTISADEAAEGKIEIDLANQTGDLADLKKNCVLSGEGKIVVSEIQEPGKPLPKKVAKTEGGISLKNAFAVAHFAITANDHTPITKVGLRGEGVYTSASVDLGSGMAVGTSEIGLEVDPETNLFFPNGKTDFYVTLVPGTVAPAFDAYYAGSYTSVIETEPETRTYEEAKSFVYYKGSKAAFSVSDNQKVAITNGNMQYVMPVGTYTSRMKPRQLKANNLVRKAMAEPIQLSGKPTIHAGYYRLAPEQWKMAIPKQVNAGTNYDYATIMKNGKTYISPEAYRYFDTPSWGKMKNPTMISQPQFTYSGKGTDTDNDFGNMLYVGSQKTRVLTTDEWNYLQPLNKKNQNLSAQEKQELANKDPKYNRYWVIETGSAIKRYNFYAKWARCYIDENDNGQRGWSPAELRGYLIFPDDMTIEDAKKAFTDKAGEPKFGNEPYNVHHNPTNYELIKASGAVFIPLTAYRAPGSKTLVQWGNHGNYFVSSYWSSGILHVKLEAGSFHIPEASAWGQGCMSRLVQNF